MTKFANKDVCPVHSDTEIKHKTYKARIQLFLATFVCIVFMAVEVAGLYIKNVNYQTSFSFKEKHFLKNKG